MSRTTEKIRRYRFNMVEIALALAVLTLGISGILALFPVGLNSGRMAIAENNLSDAASYTLGIYRAFIMNQVLSHADESGNVVDASRTFANLKSALSEPDGDDTDDINWSSASACPKMVIGGEETNLRQNGSSETILCYEQTSLDEDGDEIVEFAAVVRVWAEDLPLKIRDWVNSNGAETDVNDSSLTNQNYGLRLRLELSWPVDIPWAEREKRMYVMDLFNPQKRAVEEITGGGTP